MVFEELGVIGAFIIEPEKRADDRGFFARLWCQDELQKRGLCGHIAQINTGFSPKVGTLRGMHLQLPPHAEVKIARCTRGAAFDVVVDLRRGSASYRRWAGVELTPGNARMVYVPEGCTHGYLTLADDTELVYTTSHTYASAAARGVRYDDPAFAIGWPAPMRVISQADRSWPDFSDSASVEMEGQAQ